MKKEPRSRTHSLDIPNIDIIDLDLPEGTEKLKKARPSAGAGPQPEDKSRRSASREKDVNDEEGINDIEGIDDEEQPENDEEQDNSIFDVLLRLNWHLILVAVLIFSIVFIVHQLRGWGQRINPNDYDDAVNSEYDYEVLDSIIPLTYSGEMPPDDGITTVVVLGNRIMADDKNSPDSVCNLAASQSGAVVYNCSVADSYLAASRETFRENEEPMDAFNFYWLTTLMTMDNTSIYERAFEAMGDLVPEDARYAYETLSSLDFSTVDDIVIMYDASDYLAGRPLNNPENETDIQTFTGNLVAGIQLLQDTFPHIRIIIMSPTYAYAVNEEGEYVSSDLYIYNGQYTLAVYSKMIERTVYDLYVTYVDNLYGTINEDTAPQYLADNLIPNQAGRQKLAERMVYALTFFDR